jgi:hypothetical protein
MGSKVKDNPADGTSFEFLKVGWWVWHLIAIPAAAYLGHLFWPR